MNRKITCEYISNIIKYDDNAVILYKQTRQRYNVLIMLDKTDSLGTGFVSIIKDVKNIFEKV
jgi:hypothetical protein